jgi:hypothetical protein
VIIMTHFLVLEGPEQSGLILNKVANISQSLSFRTKR